jgi:hypothetical protein
MSCKIKSYFIIDYILFVVTDSYPKTLVVISVINGPLLFVNGLLVIVFYTGKVCSQRWERNWLILPVF